MLAEPVDGSTFEIINGADNLQRAGLDPLARGRADLHQIVDRLPNVGLDGGRNEVLAVYARMGLFGRRNRRSDVVDQ